MNILTLFNSFVNHLSNILDNNLFLHELEHNLSDSTNSLNLDILKQILEYLDLEYKNSKERKEKYYVQQTRERTLITSLGIVTFNKTYYKSKKKINGKYQYYSYLEDYIGIDKWAKLSLSAEVALINNALDNGCSWASKNSIPNYIVSRQTISQKIKNINYNYVEPLKKRNTPSTIYIEADEVHANLQFKHSNFKKNKIVPVILTHEGHLEDFAKKKQLKNTHYIASSILKTNLLWNETYNYLDSIYNLDEVNTIFISGDGGAWIKGYDEAFPNAIYVLDKFHYRKALNSIFKRQSPLTEIADEYLHSNMIDEFKILVKSQIELFPDQKDLFLKNQKYLLNNIEGIINQHHPLYNCPCSMEGHISNKYAKFITSRPHSYSSDGLENTVQLLTMKANNISLNEQIYHNFKYGSSFYKKLNLQKFISNFRLQSNHHFDNLQKYNIEHSVDNSSFSLKDNYRLDYFLSKRN